MTDTKRIDYYKSLINTDRYFDVAGAILMTGSFTLPVLDYIEDGNYFISNAPDNEFEGVKYYTRLDITPSNNNEDDFIGVFSFGTFDENNNWKHFTNVGYVLYQNGEWTF